MSAAVSLPVPAYAPASFPKRCGCGLHYTAGGWRALPCIGLQTFEGADEPIPPLELRNCPCGSTLGVEVAS